MTTAVEERVIDEPTRSWLISYGYGTLLDTLEMRGIAPTKEQWPILTSRKRTILVCGGWRGGKSQVGTDYFWGKYNWSKAGLYWLIGSSYSQTEAEYNYIADAAQHMGLIKGRLPKFVRQGPSRIELKDGTVIETRSADNPRTIAGSACDGIIQCEAAQQEQDIFHRCRSRLVDKKGWHLLTGTLEGSLGYYPKLYELWLHGTGDEQSFSLPSWSNLIIFPGGREDPEILREERELPHDVFMEKYAGIPVPPRGLVFPEFRADIHIQPVEWQPYLPVYMAVDPGFSDAASYGFYQYVNGQVRGFAEIYVRGMTASDVIQMVQGPSDFSKKYPFWKRATAKDGPGFFGTEDRYGEQHHHNSSVQEVWLKEAGVNLHSVYVKSVNDVDAVIHRLLKIDPLTGQPGVIFDPSMKGILSNFGAYPDPFANETTVYRWKQDTNGETFGTVPDDRNNHGIKGFGYWVVDQFGFVMSTQQRTAKVVYH